MHYLFIALLVITAHPAPSNMHIAAQHIVRQQKPSGLFRYEFDLVGGRYKKGNNITRQAGAGL